MNLPRGRVLIASVPRAEAHGWSGALHGRPSESLTRALPRTVLMRGARRLKVRQSQTHDHLYMAGAELELDLEYGRVPELIDGRHLALGVDLAPLAVGDEMEPAVDDYT